MQQILQQTRAFVKNYHQKDTSGHDFSHLERVYKNVDFILKTEPSADVFVVKMSALLHDVDDHKFGGDGKRAETFLKTLPLSAKTVCRILETIQESSFANSGANPSFKTIEQAILSDADKLDALGAIGISRTILFGGAFGITLFDENSFPKDDLTQAEYKNLFREGNSSINHFFDKLLKLKKAMRTKSGRAEAEKREKIMIDFLRCFFAEQNLADWLEYLEKYLQKETVDA